MKIEDNMINKFIKVTFVVVFAVIAGYGVYLSERKNILVSDLVNTNVLALADPESGSTCKGVDWQIQNVLYGILLIQVRLVDRILLVIQVEPISVMLVPAPMENRSIFDNKLALTSKRPFCSDDFGN